jgi:hypothetical protein
MFYQRAMAAMADDDEWQLIFVPWFWEQSYRKHSGAHVLTDDEKELKEAYGLSLDQMTWRKNKIKELGSVERFKQEYPCNIMEAFQASGVSFIPATMVATAQARAPNHDTHHREILGVDPAGMGEDDTTFVWRRGRDVIKILQYNKMEIESIVGLIVRELKDNDNLGKVAIDGYNMGYAIVEQLHKMGYGDRIINVLTGKPSWEPQRFANIKAQLWFAMKEWLVDAYLPPHDLIMKHLCTTAIILKNKADGSIVMQMQPKKELIDSPDIADALALTFAVTDNCVIMPQYQQISYTQPTHFLDL